MTAAAAAQHSDDERAVDASERDGGGGGVRGGWSIDVLTRGSRRPQIRHAPATVRRLYSPRYRRAVISDSSSIERSYGSRHWPERTAVTFAALCTATHSADLLLSSFVQELSRRVVTSPELRKRERVELKTSLSHWCLFSKVDTSSWQTQYKISDLFHHIVEFFWLLSWTLIFCWFLALIGFLIRHPDDSHEVYILTLPFMPPRSRL